MKNVYVILLFGCTTAPSLTQKFFDLGAKAVVGTNKVVYEPRITDPAFEGHGLFPFVFWRSLAIGDYNKDKSVGHAHSVWSAIRQGIRSVNGYLQEKGVSRIYWLSVSDFHIAGNQNTFIIY